MVKLLLVVTVLLAQEGAAKAPDGAAKAPDGAAKTPVKEGAKEKKANAAANASETDEDPAKQTDKPKDKKPAGGRTLWDYAPLIVMVMALFYFIIILPDKRKKALAQKQLEDLKTNDRVITQGGLLGTVVRVDKENNQVTLMVDESNNTRIRVLRNCINPLLPDKEPDKKTDKKT